MKIQTATKTLELDRPHVMGILNTTPDSFSDGGRYTTLDKALERAEKMIAAGVSIIDIGGESTRPGAPDVTLEEELQRVIPVVKAIRERNPAVWISVDTSKAEVMRQSVAAGADLINDIRSLTEPGALEVAAEANVPVCIMHMQGQPKTMQNAPQYDDVLADVEAFLAERMAVCEAAGIARENIILDPGFGFGKSIEHNYHLLANLEQFHRFGLPVLAGMSRKSMIFKLLDKQPADCMVASVTCASIAAMKGAQIIRVHDVEETLEAMTIIQTMNKNRAL
ncbi:MULTISPECIES: dihydropteroate synthase [Vibrio]|uniref:Dihydropteroate synthase n=2 Tax=Vibrio TaxID=662 RepID=A0A0Q2MAC7_VIBFU|nr:dihydropteroate synthase [Vibrio furnissii]EEX38967.1 dihydropteroate synthase [Vibrio furnissii CIP 102972]KQH84993.1 dihydropteroate synthase [Vibrio furnissii]MCG6214581.1 dihydropteroate synthase [Vibrio furnissii]MCG6218080.1 dihydropteroate synthase [Vibrio furnissii]MCG6231118.1 dihydropteroate synthase [Vibrio furnissii]